MSVPAPRLARQPAPARSTPARDASRQPRVRPSTAPRSTPVDLPVARRRHHLGFVLFASGVVGLMVVGLVTLNAYLAQSSFRIQDLDDRIGGLSKQHELLTKKTARLSAPGRIADWAHAHAMRLPDDGDIHILHVRGGFREATPAGDADPMVGPSPAASSERAPGAMG